VKDVVAGTAFYALKHPGVSFTRIAATHHWFNQTAMNHAEINGVVHWDGEELKNLLQNFPVSRFEVESLLAG